ncbi:MAG: exonuclease domain-containing protein [Casimicrobiaceae bacterium]
MQLFAQRLAFVDLETTGMRAAADRITEIAVVTVDCRGNDAPAQVEQWSTLVDPEVPIPPVIQVLTGITDAMVRRAPTFSSIAAEVACRLDGRVFIAHNARFDHGFLKHAFERLGRPFHARPLCTVKLSRRLFPDADGHGLDAIIARHALSVANRHRALGDALALWQFVQVLYATHAAGTIASEAKRILRIPSLPPQLAADAIESLPECAGVYRFYGDNPMPLYIGKARNLRERVGAHFSGDWRHETDLRLSAEIRRIEHEATAGEFGAMLREASLVKSLMPAHNRALRRKADAGVLRIEFGAAPQFIAAAAIVRLDGHYGPFASRRAARAMLRELAGVHALCLTRLRLEKREGPCFARQLGHCKGACVGAERAEDHDQRLLAALAPYAIAAWPFGDAAALIRESDGARCEAHVVREWRWVGTARDDGELAALADMQPPAGIDIDVTRMLLRLFARNPHAFVGISGGADCVDEGAHASMTDAATSGAMAIGGAG